MLSVAAGLASQLRTDVGGTQVFRDQDDLIGGEPWSAGIDAAIDDATSSLFLVGANWVTNGTTTIWDDDDPVRREAERALARADGTAIPVFVDGAHRPDEGPPWVDRLFGGHAVEATSTSLTTGSSGGYQHILIALLNSLRKRNESSVLIVGDNVAAVDIDETIEAIKKGSAKSVRVLARFSCGATLITPRVAKRQRHRWPDVIVLADEPSDTLRERVDALLGYPDLRVAVYGAAATLLAGGTAAGVVSTFADTAAAASLPTQNSAVAAVSSASLPVKVGAGAVTAAAVVGVAAIVQDPDPAFGATTTISAPTLEDERFYPLGRPGDVVVSLVDGSDPETKQVVVEFADGPGVTVGDVVIPSDFDRWNGQSPGWYRVDSVSTTLDGLPILGMPIEDYCYPTNDPADAIGGWEISEETGTIRIDLVIRVDGSVQDTAIDVALSAQTDRRWLVEPDADLDTSRCPEVDTRNVTWTSRSDE